MTLYFFHSHFLLPSRLLSRHLLSVQPHPPSPHPSPLTPLSKSLNTSLPSQTFVCPLSTFLTVIQDVDSSSLEATYQSFASLMEQRLAELFLVAGRQGSRTTRSRRATTVGGYTVQVYVNSLYHCQQIREAVLTVIANVSMAAHSQ